MQVRSLEIVVNIPSIDQFSRLALDLSTHCLCILNNPHLNASVPCSLCVRFQIFELFKWMKAYWESRRISLESFKKHCAIALNVTPCFSSFGRYSVRSVTLKQPRIASKTKTDQCSKVLPIKTINFELKSFQKTQQLWNL